MTPHELIRSIPAAAAAFDAGDDPECISLLNTPSITVTDDGLKGVPTIIRTIGQDNTRTVLDSLVASGDQIALVGRDKLVGAGLNFSHPTTVDMIHSFAELWPPSVADLLLALGSRVVSPAVAHCGRDVTAAELVTLRVTLRAAARYNAVSAAITEGVTDWVTLTELFASDAVPETLAQFIGVQ